MKKLLFLFVIIPSLIFSQCPDGKANEYKQKAEQYGDASYSTLAVYYYYKCQCENGIANRTAKQVNAMVDQYNGLKANRAGSNSISLPNQHQVQWVNLNTFTGKCGKSNSSNPNGAKVNNGSETKTVKKPDPFFTKDFLEENIKNLINGDSDKVLTNINNEIQVRNTMKNTGLDRNTAQGINTLANGLIEEIAKEFNRPKTPEELRLKFEKKFQKQGSSSYWANDTLIMISSSKYGTKTVNYSKNGLGRTEVYNADNIIVSEHKTKSLSFSKQKTIEKMVFVTADYEKKTNYEYTVNGDLDIIKHVNLLTNEVIVDYTNATETQEPLLDENGKNIGTKILMDGNLFKTSVPNKKEKTVKEISYHLGKKTKSQVSTIKFKTVKIPIEIIEYDENELIKKKIIFKIDKRKSTLIETDYEQGEPIREVQKVNGEVISDKQFD